MPRSIPESVKPTITAFQNVAANRNAPANEKAKNTQTLAKRLAILRKRNPKWAIVLTLLAAGSVGYAAWYAGLFKLPLSKKLLDQAAKARTVVKNSRVGKAIGTKAATYVKTARQAATRATGAEGQKTWWGYGPTKEATWSNIGAAAKKKVTNRMTW